LQDQLTTLNQELEERVEQRTEKIKQLLRQKDAFVNQLSHDLKTPLTPLVALLPMVANRTEDTESKRMLGLVIENVNYMKNLTEMTLQLARINSSSVGLKPERVDLASEIRNIIECLSPVFEENGIKVVNNTTVPLVVEADRMLIKGLLHNLISNAVKYTNGNGVVTFGITMSGGNVKVSVKDNGVGMAEEQLKHVFEEFYKVDDSRNDRSSTGLGLAICQRIIEKHGGKIWAESQGIGHGTTVHFTLPTRQGERQKNANIEKIGNAEEYNF
jgi:signal transduction histidine kinase